ncbi:MAG: glutamate--tRNA ligase family protein [Desulfobacterales bacterium]|nr:glutamate--tRNA ligase family protein [Desulfobacterales bacterium]
MRAARSSAGLAAFERRTPDRSAVYSAEQRRAAALSPGERRRGQGEPGRVGASSMRSRPTYNRTVALWIQSRARRRRRGSRRLGTSLIDLSARGQMVPPFVQRPDKRQNTKTLCPRPESASPLLPPVTCTSAAPHRALQLALRAAHRRDVRPPDRGHRHRARRRRRWWPASSTGMRWLGLDWDEGPDVGGPCGPYFQSERLDRYRDAAERLVAAGHALLLLLRRPSELEANARRREAARRVVVATTARCAALSRRTRSRRARRPARRAAVRFRVPAGTDVRSTIVGARDGSSSTTRSSRTSSCCGPTATRPTTCRSSSTTSTWRITHVVRGDDHISNTPKQVLLYRGARRAACRAFAHVPLILGPDKRRLSKRHGATSVMEYERAGVSCPRRWSTSSRCSAGRPGRRPRAVHARRAGRRRSRSTASASSNAVFNPEKLEWFNGQHIARLGGDEIATRLEPMLAEAGPVERCARRRAARVVPPGHRDPQAAREEAARHRRAGRATSSSIPRRHDEAAVAKHLSAPGLAGHLAGVGRRRWRPSSRSRRRRSRRRCARARSRRASRRRR